MLPLLPYFDPPKKTIQFVQMQSGYRGNTFYIISISSIPTFHHFSLLGLTHITSSYVLHPFFSSPAWPGTRVPFIYLVSASHSFPSLQNVFFSLLFFFLYPSMSLSICLSANVSISVGRFVRISVVYSNGGLAFTCLLSVCLSECQSVCQSMCQCVCQHVCQYVC